VSLVRNTGEHATIIQSIRHWRSQARFWLRDKTRGAEILELLAAGALEVDLIVTGRSDLLALRSRSPFDDLNILSPHEAFPVVGVWSRAIGQVHVLGQIGMADWYPWILTRALTPSAWPGYAAFQEGQRALPNGREVFAFSNSILFRIDRLIQMLDRMALIWMRNRQFGLAAMFDGVVLAVSAIQDNLARLVGTYFGITLDNSFDWTSLSSEWRKELRKISDERAQQLLVFLERVTPALKLPQEFRQHAIHRDLLPAIATGAIGRVREERIELAGDVLSHLKECLGAMHEGPPAWGIEEEREPHVERHILMRDDGSEEAYEEPIPLTE
jgi:hypothetical protein